MSAFTQVADAIKSVKPEPWRFLAYEPLADFPDITCLTLKVRTVARLDVAPIYTLRVEWILTITSPFPSRETADPQLFDDLILFLNALDDAPGLGWITWTEASKTVGDDEERLAYDITLQTHHTRDS